MIDSSPLPVEQLNERFFGANIVVELDALLEEFSSLSERTSPIIARTVAGKNREDAGEESSIWPIHELG